jgi:hypothetical protein
MRGLAMAVLDRKITTQSVMVKKAQIPKIFNDASDHKSYIERFPKISNIRENRKNMHGGQIFFCGVGLFYIYQNLGKDVNF